LQRLIGFCIILKNYLLYFRTIQELLGRQNLQTTLIYTHVASKNILGVRSPLDR
jgi:site-specific recombinase XerD